MGYAYDNRLYIYIYFKELQFAAYGQFVFVHFTFNDYYFYFLMQLNYFLLLHCT